VIILPPLIILKESPSAFDDLIAFDDAFAAEPIRILSSFTEDTSLVLLNLRNFKLFVLVFMNSIARITNLTKSQGNNNINFAYLPKNQFII